MKNIEHAAQSCFKNAIRSLFMDPSTSKTGTIARWYNKKQVLILNIPWTFAGNDKYNVTKIPQTIVIHN